MSPTEIQLELLLKMQVFLFAFFIAFQYHCIEWAKSRDIPLPHEILKFSIRSFVTV